MLSHKSERVHIAISWVYEKLFKENHVLHRLNLKDSNKLFDKKLDFETLITM